MKRITLLRGGLTALFLSFMMAGFAQADKPAKIGRMNTADFEQRITKGTEQMNAFAVNKVALQTEDLKAINSLAVSVLRQQAIAEAVRSRLTDPELTALVTAQLQAQQALWQLLQKFSAEKKFTLPSPAEAKAPQQAERVAKNSGKALDKAYLVESAVKGHQEQMELLMQAKTGREANLKAMATQATPMIKTLAQAAEQVQQKMFPMVY